MLTARGGATSHAAVVTRGLGIPCVAGCESIVVDFDEGEFRVGEKIVHRGDFVSIDGSSGEVYEGHIPTIDPDFTKEAELQTLLEWADEERRLQVWANADYPRDAKRAREFGAQGIGLDRTEHMFMETDRLPIVHEMILAAPEYRKVKRQRETLANQMWPRANPLGQRITLRRSSQKRPDYGQPISGLVIGVIKDVRQFSISARPRHSIAARTPLGR